MIEQRLQCVRLKGRDADAPVPATQELSFVPWKAITLIEDQGSGQCVEIQFLKDFHNGGNLNVDVGGARIDHMHQEIRFAQLLQRRPKCSQQLLREIADKPDSIGHDDFAVSRKT